MLLCVIHSLPFNSPLVIACLIAADVCWSLQAITTAIKFKFLTVVLLIPHMKYCLSRDQFVQGNIFV